MAADGYECSFGPGPGTKFLNDLTHGLVDNRAINGESIGNLLVESAFRHQKQDFTPQGRQVEVLDHDNQQRELFP
jgi:hypothetical protein